MIFFDFILARFDFILAKFSVFYFWRFVEYIAYILDKTIWKKNTCLCTHFCSPIYGKAAL